MQSVVCIMVTRRLSVPRTMPRTITSVSRRDKRHSQVHAISSTGGHWGQAGAAHLRVAAQQVRFREREPREYSRGAKRGAGLAATLGAMADVQGERLVARRLERHSSALALGLHIACLMFSLAGESCGWTKEGGERAVSHLVRKRSRGLTEDGSSHLQL